MGLAVALSAVAVAGCGGSSAPATPSGLNPANMVPAGSLLYASLSVRPQGTLKQDLVQVIDDIGGANAATELVNKAMSASGSNGRNTWSQVKPWLDQRVGAALIGLPPEQLSAQSLLNYAVLVLPTTDPSAANSYLSSQLTDPALVTYKIEGDYALVGGPYAVQMAGAVTARTSLVRSRGYRQLVRQIGQGAFTALYLRPYPFLKFETKLLSQEAAPPANLALIEQSMSKVPSKSAAMVTLNTTANTLRLEYATVDATVPGQPTHGATTGVAGLPAGSWLAVALSGGLSNSATLKNLETPLRQLSTQAAGRLGAESNGLSFFTNDVLPALGPMSLSVSGQTEATAKLGFALTPASPAAGDRLLALVRRMLGNRAPKQLQLGRDGDQLVATYGYKSFGEMLAPQRSLSSNPVFRRASQQLPQGSLPYIFVNFAPIEALVKLDGGAKSAGVAQVLSRLDYLIAGARKGSFQLVLGVR
jgi:hypothetical protein